MVEADNEGDFSERGSTLSLSLSLSIDPLMIVTLLFPLMTLYLLKH